MLQIKILITQKVVVDNYLSPFFISLFLLLFIVNFIVIIIKFFFVIDQAFIVIMFNKKIGCMTKCASGWLREAHFVGTPKFEFRIKY